MEYIDVTVEDLHQALEGTYEELGRLVGNPVFDARVDTIYDELGRLLIASKALATHKIEAGSRAILEVRPWDRLYGKEVTR